MVRRPEMINKFNTSLGDKVFNYLNNIFMLILSISFIIPFYHILIISVSPIGESSTLGFHFWPSRFFLEGYRVLLKYKFLWIGFGNTIYRVVLGVSLSLLVMSAAAYALTKKDLPGRKIIIIFITFTMFFSGGLIPSFLITRSLGLMNNRLVYVLPQLANAFSLLLLRNYFMTVPDSLEESAKIDGAGYIRIFFSIIIPVVKPILATIALWIAVSHWNQWFDGLIYITDPNKRVAQIVLRTILDSGNEMDMMRRAGNPLNVPSTETFKSAAVFVTTIPILLVYPFIQRYFVTGITLGSVKG
jgi:putative aldouronate transport system permease protein